MKMGIGNNGGAEGQPLVPGVEGGAFGVEGCPVCKSKKRNPKCAMCGGNPVQKA